MIDWNDLTITGVRMARAYMEYLCRVALDKRYEDLMISLLRGVK